MKQFLISLIFVCLTTILLSCHIKNRELIKCSYSDLLLENYEVTKEKIAKHKNATFYITGIIKRIDRPKDQPLNECSIYFYGEKTFNAEKWVGKLVLITVKPMIEQDMIGKQVTIKCNYKRMDSIKLEEDQSNCFWIDFRNGKLIDE